jgi:hypothetical protein
VEQAAVEHRVERPAVQVKRVGDRELGVDAAGGGLLARPRDRRLRAGGVGQEVGEEADLWLPRLHVGGVAVRRRLEESVRLQDLEQEERRRLVDLGLPGGGNLLGRAGAVEQRRDPPERVREERVAQRERELGRPQLESAVAEVDGGSPRREQRPLRQLHPREVRRAQHGFRCARGNTAVDARARHRYGAQQQQQQ